MDHALLGRVDDHLAAQAVEDAPDFVNTTGRRRIHDWRNYVGERITAMWGTLAPDVRLAIAMDAQEMADKEDWD